MKKDKWCPLCGQELPPPLPEIARYLSKGEAAILALVHKGGQHGYSFDRLVDALYSHDPNGGPEFAEVTVRTRIAYLNKKLKLIGKRITYKAGVCYLGDVPRGPFRSRNGYVYRPKRYRRRSPVVNGLGL